MTDFGRILELAREEQRIRSAIDRQRARATRSAAPTISDMPRSGGGNKQRLEEDVVNLVSLQEEHTVLQKELTAARAELKRDIRQLKTASLRTILRMRYLQNSRISIIAEDMSYSERQVQRIIRDGETQIHRIQRAREQRKNMSLHVAHPV